MTLLTEGKSTVYYRARFDDTLSVSGQNFAIRTKAGDIREKFPALSTRDIVIFGDVTLTNKVLSLARTNHVPIHFIDGKGRFVASVLYDYTKNVFLRHAQFKWHDDKEKRREMAYTFVRGKIINQNRVLKKMRATQRLNTLPDNVSQNLSLDTIRGMEGTAARQYFRIWRDASLVKNNADFVFPGRIKHPATDPLNALLSFCYTLAHAELVTHIMIVGLDPYVGFLHDQKYGHAALASDFLEIYRGPIEYFVLRSVNRREFTQKDFTTDDGGVVSLSRHGYGTFFPKWSRFIRYDHFAENRTLVALMERDVRQLAQILIGDRDTFKPFEWKRV